MKEHTIMIFPKFKNIQLIDEIRIKYDPLVKLVQPHVTLVFPFKSELTDEEILRGICSSLDKVSKFKLTLKGIEKSSDSYGNYIFLKVKEGNDEIVNLHDRLYEGIFKKYKVDIPYVPHMTVGNLKTVKEMELAYKELKNNNYQFETIVDTISVEMIGENGESIVNINYKLE